MSQAFRISEFFSSTQLNTRESWEMPPSLQGEHIFNVVGDLANELVSLLHLVSPLR